MNIVNMLNVLPDFCDNILDNKWITEEFTKTIYNTICSMNPFHINKICKSYSKKIYFNSTDIIDSFIVTSNNDFNYHTSFTYVRKDTIPFCMIYNNVLVCYFPSKKSILHKITTYNHKYLSYELDLHKQDEYSHSLLLLFDTLLKEIYIINSNKTNNYIDNNLLITAITGYAEQIEYKFDNSKIINLDINKTNNKSFVNGYCRAWTLLFQYIANNATDNFDFIQYIYIFIKYDADILNNIIESYHKYLYHTFIKQTKLESISKKIKSFDLY